MIYRTREGSPALLIVASSVFLLIAIAVLVGGFVCIRQANQLDTIGRTADAVVSDNRSTSQNAGDMLEYSYTVQGTEYNFTEHVSPSDWRAMPVGTGTTVTYLPGSPSIAEHSRGRFRKSATMQFVVGGGFVMLSGAGLASGIVARRNGGSRPS